MVMHGYLLPDAKEWPDWIWRMNGHYVYAVLHPSYRSVQRGHKGLKP